MSEKITLEEKSPIEFPCDFIVKVLIHANDDHEEKVINIALRNFPKLDVNTITKRSSKDDNYWSLTITVYAENKAQLDKLYTELSGTEEVIMAL